MNEIKRKIKYKRDNYELKIETYSNNRMKLIIKNKTSSHDLSLNLSDIYLKEGHIFLNPIIVNDGFFNSLKKSKIINSVVNTVIEDNLLIPIVKLNMGILRKYDNDGVNHYLSTKGEVL